MVDVAAPKTSAIITLAAVVVIIAGMKAASALIVPFMIATFLALITVRPMLWLQANRVPTVLAALLIVVTILSALTVVGVVVGRSLAAFTAALPAYQAQLQGLMDGAVSFLAQYTDSDQSVERVGDLINPGWAMGLAATLLNAVRDIMTNTLLITFTVIFILLEASSFPTKITAAFGESARSLTGARQFLDDLGRYLGIKTLVSIVTGLLVWLLTWKLGLDFPRLWGMLAFLLNYIPTIGSIIAAVPAVLLALVQLGVWGGDGYRDRFHGDQRCVRQLHRAPADGLRRRHFAPDRIRRADLLGLGVRPGRHAAVGAAVDDPEAGAGERRANALGCDLHRFATRRAAHARGGGRKSGGLGPVGRS